MAEEGIKVPLPWGGDLVATGFNVVFIIAFVGMFYLLLEQNKLVAQQTLEIRAGQDILRCNVGIDIFVHQFQPGQIDWNKLPVQLYKCLREYNEKLPREKDGR